MDMVYLVVYIDTDHDLEEDFRETISYAFSTKAKAQAYIDEEVKEAGDNSYADNFRIDELKVDVYNTCATIAQGEHK